MKKLCLCLSLLILVGCTRISYHDPGGAKVSYIRPPFSRVEIGGLKIVKGESGQVEVVLENYQRQPDLAALVQALEIVNSVAGKAVVP